MEIKLICNNKFQFAYDTIGLPVFLKNLPKEIVFQGDTLLLKSDFHVSLVCIGEIIKKHNITISDFKNKIINDFCEFSETSNIDKISFTNNFKFATRDDLKSIIVMCKVPNLDKFFDLMNKKYSLNIEYPPTHVTLYTPLSKTGIFLIDSNDIKNLTVPIENPIDHLL
jgi:hypothetical protein